VVERYRRATESPPTRWLERLKCWSTSFHWQARLALHEAELERARQEELQRLAREQARQDSRLLHGVGEGALATAAVLLADLVDPATGAPKRPAQARDIQALARAGIDCLHAATGTGDAEAADPNAVLREALNGAPADIRGTILRAIRSLTEWREGVEARR
jgi:hypothetical protein